jgi:creatinine amidohydrolase
VHVVLASASYWTLGREAMASLGTYDRFAHVPGHAGDFETSVVLALRPDLVDLGARREPLAALQGLAHSARPGNFARAGGTTDNASKADGAFGRQMLDAVIGAVADYLVEFHGVPGVSGSS